MNWLLLAVEKFLGAGGVLRKKREDISVGYSILRANVSRDNGNEWQGAVYGINLEMDELYAVVEWAGDSPAHPHVSSHPRAPVLQARAASQKLKNSSRLEARGRMLMWLRTRSRHMLPALTRRSSTGSHLSTRRLAAL